MISGIALAGVVVATTAIVIVLSVFNGFSNLAESQLSIVDPPLSVVPTQGKVLTATLDGAIPVVSEQGLAMVGDRQHPVTLLGVPDEWLTASGIGQTVIDGVVSLGDTIVGQAALMALGPAVTLSTHPGDERGLRIYVPRRKGRVNPANPMTAFREQRMEVAGVFQTGNQRHDQELIILPINTLRQMLDYDSTQASAMEIWGTTAKPSEIQSLLGNPQGIKVLTRIEQEQHSFSMIAVEKWVTFLMLVFILLIAMFNVLSTLSLLILEKRDSRHIFDAMGMSPERVRGIFAWEGAMVTALGGVVGVILGVLLSLAQQWGRFIKLSGDPTMMVIDVYPVEVHVGDVLVVLGLVVVTSALTAWLTSLIAKRI
ncbi:MAG: FtsX-like permease family protein [Bacteroidales bacterium]|nr:FtsX-like permease family protein [Bacteroidales bacterium]MCD8393692.1 FtsX-like permease family protein [Bacteroidales bacterium]